jgi:predicted peptidase
MRRFVVAVAAAAAAGMLAPIAAAQPAYPILPQAPESRERQAPISALRSKGAELARAFAPHVHTNAEGERMPYRLFTPGRLEPGRRYPLVVFLHGAGGSGRDNVKQLQGANVFGGLVWTLPANQSRHPAFVLAPQSDVNWACTLYDPKNPPKTLADMRFCAPEALGIGARLAFEIINALVLAQPIDPDRIYVTGHSMGGAGAWHMIAHRPRFFAAAVPVCGHPLPATAAAVKDVPIWNFHGEADEVEPVATSRVMIDAIRRAGGTPRHTEYAGVGHNVFMWVYTEPALVEWVFAQRR